MPFIRCPHCDHQIPDDPALAGRPDSCPACDRRFRRPLPVAEPAPTVHQQERQPVIIEQTSQHWKLVQLIGACSAIFFGALCSVASTTLGASAAQRMSFAVMLISLGIFVVGRIGAWWHQG